MLPAALRGMGNSARKPGAALDETRVTAPVLGGALNHPGGAGFKGQVDQCLEYLAQGESPAGHANAVPWQSELRSGFPG